MALTDLYTPRVEAETARSLGREKLTVDTLNDAAKNLFQYSLQKQEIDKAYAEIQAKADQTNKQTYWDDQMKSNELAAKRVNAAAIGVASDPNNQAAVQVLEDAFTTYSGARPNWTDPQTGMKKAPPDVVDHLTKLVIDPATGGFTHEGARLAFDVGKPDSDMGKMISDMTKLREAGVSEGDPRIQTMKDAMIKATSTDINQQAGEMLRTIWEKKGPAAAIGMYEYWKTLGTGSTTNINIKPPGGTERQAVVNAIVLNKKLEMIRNMWNKIQDKYGNLINKPTGPGAETIQGMLGFIPGASSDPLITEFHKAVNDYQQDRVKAITGAQHSDQEYERYVGDHFSGGSMIGNHLSKEAFGTTLDLNQEWGKNYLQTLLETQHGYGLKTPSNVDTGGKQEPEKPSAANENQGGTNQKPDPNAELQSLKERRNKLLKDKADAAKEGLGGPEPNQSLRGPLKGKRRVVPLPSGSVTTLEPHAALFQRALDVLGPNNAMG